MTNALHDRLVKKARSLAKGADAQRIAGAFVVSLGDKPSFWRVPLMALAATEAMPAHTYAALSSADESCRECGFDPLLDGDVDADEPLTTLLPNNLALAVDALERAKKSAVRTPAPADVARLQRMLAIVGELPASAGESKLNEAWRREKLVLGNKYDCRHVIETLGACGILETKKHPGFTTKWTPFEARKDKPARTECDPPIAFWTAKDGVNAGGVTRWFGHLGRELCGEVRRRRT